MEGPSIVPIIVPLIMFLTAAVLMWLIWHFHWKRLIRQYVQSGAAVMTTHHPQYSYHQAMSLQPAYGGRPILTGPRQQTCVTGPSPMYQEDGLFPAPYSQAAFDDDDQIMYPLQAPVQPALPTDYTSPQTLYEE